MVSTRPRAADAKSNTGVGTGKPKDRKADKAARKSNTRSAAAAAPQWEVEQIVDQKLDGGEQFYLVKWKGVDQNGTPWSQTWEPEENLDCDDLVDAFLNSAASNSGDSAFPEPKSRKSKGSSVVKTGVSGVKLPQCCWKNGEWYCECGDTGCGSEPGNSPPASGVSLFSCPSPGCAVTRMLTISVSTLDRPITVFVPWRVGSTKLNLRSVLSVIT